MQKVKFSKEIIYQLFFIIGFLIVLYLLFAFVVMNDVDRLQKLKNRYFMQKQLATYVQQNSIDLRNSIHDLNETIEFMDKVVDEQALFQFLLQFFQNVVIKKVNDSMSDGLETSKYYIEATTDTMKNFYDFIEAIEKRKYPLQLSYPITFKRESNTSIAVTFFLTLYQLKSNR